MIPASKTRPSTVPIRNVAMVACFSFVFVYSSLKKSSSSVKLLNVEILVEPSLMLFSISMLKFEFYKISVDYTRCAVILNIIFW